MAAEFESAEFADDVDEEMDEDEESDDSSSSDDEIMEADPEIEAKIRELQKQISMNPYGYDPYVEVIRLLRTTGDLDRLRQARENMSQMFPLTEQLWLDWLQDEIKLAVTGEEKEHVEGLFERACSDYLSVGVWLEYVQFSVGFMADEGGMERVRGAFEKALSRVGVHLAKGCVIWEAYREFENAILFGLQPGVGAVMSSEQRELLASQTGRVNSLFRRQLSVPLLNLEETLSEYLAFSGEERNKLPADIRRVYEKSREQLTQVIDYEQQLAGSPDRDVYDAYLKDEMDRGDPARVQCLLERAIQDHCLVPDYWLQYVKYLDRELCHRAASVSVHQRAVRNCPWSVELWLSLLRAMERSAASNQDINSTFEKAVAVGYTEGSDYLQLWTGYCDYLRRQIDWKAEDNTKSVEKLRTTLERAVDYLDEAFPSGEGDPDCTLLQYWARMEGECCDDMERARVLWSRVLQAGHGSQAHMWLNYYQLERAHGDEKHVRKLLQRAVNSVSDWPETVCETYLTYEREHGTLEQYDQAVVRCEAQMKRVEERHKQSEEKEAKKTKFNKKTKDGKETKKGGAQDTKKEVKKDFKKDAKNTKKSSPVKTNSGQRTKQRADTENGQPVTHKRNVEVVSGRDSDGFKVPSELPTKARSKAPPPGYKPKPETTENADHPPPAKKPRVDSEGAGDTPPGPDSTGHDPSKDRRTVFVSNLSYNVDEEQIRDVFKLIGDITEVRLIKNFKGKSKGFAYVEFEDELAAQRGLSLDRQPLDGRPVYVSECNSKKTDTAKFKFCTDLEKNKLFVKNLPFSATQQQLEEIFKEYGELKEVRLVTYRSGASKGLAYVEYTNESSAAQAVMKTDGLMVGEHSISVAISNPPARRAPVSQRGEGGFTPSLGGGKKDAGGRGKAHTLVSLMPRALQRKPSTPTTTSTTTSTTQHTASTSDQSSEKKSNADFRSMLLNK